MLVGGATVDISGRPKAGTTLLQNTSNPGVITISFGGVARNVSTVLQKLNQNPLLISAIADDYLGEMLTKHMQELGFVSSTCCKLVTV